MLSLKIYAWHDFLSQGLLDPSMRTYVDQSWEWLEKTGVPAGDVAGYYLFLSPDRQALREIARQELEGEEFSCCRISRQADGRGCFELQLFHLGPFQGAALAHRHSSNPRVRFGGWQGKSYTVAQMYRTMCRSKKEFF